MTDMVFKKPCTKKANVENLKKENLTIGDYVLVSKYSDVDPNDPWAIGIIYKLELELYRGDIVYISIANEDRSLISKVGIRHFKYFKKLTAEEGASYIKYLTENETCIL